MCYYEQAETLTEIAWGTVQVRSTPQNSLSEQLDKGEVKWETGTEIDEESSRVMLSVSDIHTETSVIWKWNCWLCLVPSLHSYMQRSGGKHTSEPSVYWIPAISWMLIALQRYCTTFGPGSKMSKICSSFYMFSLFFWCSFVCNSVLPPPVHSPLFLFRSHEYHGERFIITFGIFDH